MTLAQAATIATEDPAGRIALPLLIMYVAVKDAFVPLVAAVLKKANGFQPTGHNKPAFEFPMEEWIAHATREEQTLSQLAAINAQMAETLNELKTIFNERIPNQNIHSHSH